MTTHPPQPTVIGGLSPDALSSMFQAIAALRNFRAAAAILSGLLVGGLLAGAIVAVAGANLSGMFLGGLMFFVFVSTGAGAATVLLMDQARGVAIRRFTDAMVYGLICVPKVIVLLIGVLLAALGVFIVLAIAFFLCKMPGLGPVLFTIVFPLAVVTSGVTLAGLYLCSVMAIAAIYDGATVGRAMAQSFAILRSRLVESLVLISIVMLLSFIVAAIVFSVLFAGFVPTAALSGSIVGAHDFGSITSVFGGGFGGGGGGHLVAGAIGTGVLWAVAWTLVAQVAILGTILVYLRVTEGLDASATESAMMMRLDEARRKATDMGQRAKEAAERAREQARTAANARSVKAAAAPRAPVLAPTCPQCHKTITDSDVFCAECGFKLK
jgi:hypothetical protein